MDEYIEREALITKFKKMELGEHGLVERLFADGVYAVIAAFPAADVAPVVRGHKVDDGGSTPDALNATGYCLFVPTIAQTAERRWTEVTTMRLIDADKLENQFGISDADILAVEEI